MYLKHEDLEDNLSENFTGEQANDLQATYGTPFLLAQNSADFSDGNNVIQAHNMRNGSMFAWLGNAALNNPDLLKNNRFVYLLTPSANYCLASVSVLNCYSDDEVTRVNFSSSLQLQEFASSLIERSVVDFGLAGSDSFDVSCIEKLVCLSTCTSDGTNRRCVLVCAVYDMG